MRQLASVIGSLGLLFAAYLSLAPVSVAAPHGDGRCGPPAIRVAADEGSDDPNEQAVIDRCEEVAADRLVRAAVAVGIGMVGFLVIRAAAVRHDVVVRRRRQAQRREREAEARDAAVQAARFADAIARDAALRG